MSYLPQPLTWKILCFHYLFLKKMEYFQYLNKKFILFQVFVFSFISKMLKYEDFKTITILYKDAYFLNREHNVTVVD